MENLLMNIINNRKCTANEHESQNTLKRLKKHGKIVKATADGLSSTIMAERRRIW